VWQRVWWQWRGLQACHPACALPRLITTPPPPFTTSRYLDLRQVHVEEELRFWSPAKCATMQHITALSKALRRKNRHCQVLYDTS
jgi:hypothetical protein